MSTNSKLPKRSYIDIVGERAAELFTHHKIHIVSAHFPSYMSYHCCHITEDGSKKHGWDFFVAVTGSTILMHGDLRFCAWSGSMDILRAIKDINYISEHVPPNIQIRETRKSKITVDGVSDRINKFTGEYLLQYWGLRWFAEHLNKRENYHITHGTKHSDTTLAMVPQQ